MNTSKEFEYHTATKPFLEKACELVVETYEKFAKEKNFSVENMPTEIAFCKAALQDEYHRKEIIANASVPKEKDLWQHRNGKIYEILFLANLDNNPSTNYEPHVVYENVNSKTRWSRPLSDWHRSFGLEPIKPSKIS